MIGYFKSLREAIRTGAVNFVKTQSELMKASEKPSCTVRTQRSDQDSSRPLLARGKTAKSRFYRASVPVGTPVRGSALCPARAFVHFCAAACTHVGFCACAFTRGYHRAV